jgi:hypothetical protein
MWRGIGEMIYTELQLNMKVRDFLEDLGIERRKILKWILKK